MRKHYFALFTFCYFLFFSFSLFAQFNLSGKITDDEGDLVGAHVLLKNTFKAIYTNEKGEFLFKNLSSGKYILQISYIGYENFIQEIELTQDQTLAISLKKSTFLADEVVIVSTRASEKTATAYTNISKEDLAKQNLGQDLPILLNFTPSVVTTSDAGAGVGYTGIRIRGTDPTRINVTVNGIPINDAESQGVFWVNMPDFASSVANIQVQRGVGTSTNGAGAFGGSINVQTNTLQEKPYAQLNNSYGSFNTWKHTILVGTGLLDDKFTLDARLSKIKSDGYIDRAFSDLKSFYVSGAYHGKNTLLRANVFSGKETTYQAWEGVPEALLDSLPTYNPFTYKNQTDNYQQDHYQLILSQKLSKNLNFNTALHYTKGRGYYEELKTDQDFSKYGLPSVTIGDSLISTTDLVRRRWLDNDFFGITYALDYNSNKLKINVGGGWNQYVGKHFGEVIWSKIATNNFVDYRYYENDALKTDFNIYTKFIYQITNSFNGFVDLQYRKVSYSFLGFNKDLENIQQNVTFNFFNPKAGLTFALNDQNNLYASYGIGNKEPNRNDFTQSSPDSRPKAESLQNLEAGYQFKASKISFSLNYYYMNYLNQLVLTGQVNDVGAYNRTNIAHSYRTGIEVEVGFKPFKKLTWQANATISQNKIKNFNEFIDDYDQGTQVANTYASTDIAFSPNLIAGSQLSYTLLKALDITLLTKYVGKQFLDNTSNNARKINPYLTNDIRFSYGLSPKFIKKIDVIFLLNNVLNVKYASNGYTFSYITGNQINTENYYYPQAGRNFLLGVNMSF